MKPFNLHICICLFASCLLFGFKEKVSLTDKIVESFTLKDIYGNSFSLGENKKNKGYIIVFTCNHCPFAKLYQERLSKLNTKYKDKGFPLIAINSVRSEEFPEETIEELKRRAEEKSYNFRYLVDDKQEIARIFGAGKTPHAFVLYNKNNKWIIKYNGAIDDNGAEPAAIKHAYVENAVTDLLLGNEVSVKETKSIGCSIKFKPNNK